MSSLIGILNVPGEWYESLNKPPFTPPNWLFGPVWTTLYILIAIAGWRTFRAGANTVPARSLIWAPVQSVSLDPSGVPTLTIPGVGQLPTTAVRKVG